jgi:DNA repair ATPase RecN
MSEEKNIDSKIDELEKITDPNAVITIAGYSFTPAKLMIAGTIVTSIVGGLYATFEVYKDYMDMKEKIAEYVTPDLTEMYEKIAVSDKKMDGIEKSVTQATDYTSDIKNDLKSDIRRLENVVENVERSVKQSQRETDAAIKDVQKDSRTTLKEIETKVNTTVKELERSQKQLEREVDQKIKRSLDNPLNN